MAKFPARRWKGYFSGLSNFAFGIFVAATEEGEMPYVALGLASSPNPFWGDGSRLLALTVLGRTFSLHYSMPRIVTFKIDKPSD